MSYFSMIPYSLPGNNEQLSYPVTFRYDPSRASLEVRLDGEIQTGNWNYDSVSGAVVFQTPPDGSELLIRRVTALDERDVVFNARSILSEKEQNRNTDQLFDALQEAYDMGVYLSDDSFGMLNALRGAVETCLTSASNAATSAATAGTIASQIALIWTEITGDDSLFENAFATAQELMEAKGAVDAAAAAGIAGVNEASLAALNAAKTEIEEAKDSSLETLDSTLQSASNNLNGIVSGADASLALKLAEAKGAATAAEAAQAAAANSGSAAQASADAASASAATAATKAGEAASSSSAALAAKQEAEAAKVAAVAAQVAAEAALGEGESLVNQSITAHNANPQAHAGFLLPLAGGTMTGELLTTATNGFRMSTGPYGVFFRKDSSSFYIMVTAENDPTGGYTTARPLTIDLATGECKVNGIKPVSASEPTFIGGIEISGDTPYIDFHFNSDSRDYTSRIYETASGNLTLIGNLNVTGKLTSAQGEGTFSGTGYQKLPGGLIIQWGEYTLATTSRTDEAYEENKVAFPIAFPTACCALTANCHYSSTSFMGADGDINVRFDRTHYLILSASDTNKRISWIAIGY